MIRGRKGETLATWIDAAMASPLASFAAGIRADQNAVAAAIVEPWSNGQTEGQITKLKQAGQAADVRTRQARPAARPPRHRRLTTTSSRVRQSPSSALIRTKLKETALAA
jgi:hypothetical protein